MPLLARKGTNSGGGASAQAVDYTDTPMPVTKAGLHKTDKPPTVMQRFTWWCASIIGALMMRQVKFGIKMAVYAVEYYVRSLLAQAMWWVKWGSRLLRLALWVGSKYFGTATDADAPEPLSASDSAAGPSTIQQELDDNLPGAGKPVFSDQQLKAQNDELRSTGKAAASTAGATKRRHVGNGNAPRGGRAMASAHA